MEFIPDAVRLFKNIVKMKMLSTMKFRNKDSSYKEEAALSSPPITVSFYKQQGVQLDYNLIFCWLMNKDREKAKIFITPHRLK